MTILQLSPTTQGLQERIQEALALCTRPDLEVHVYHLGIPIIVRQGADKDRLQALYYDEWARRFRRAGGLLV